VFHDDEVCSLVFSQVIHAADILVSDLAGKTEFVAEAVDGLLIAGNFWPEDLEGYFLVDLGIHHAVETAHASPSQFFDDLVSVGKDSSPPQFSDRSRKRLGGFVVSFGVPWSRGRLFEPDPAIPAKAGVFGIFGLAVRTFHRLFFRPFPSV